MKKAFSPIGGYLIGIVAATVAATLVAPQATEVLAILLPNVRFGMIIEPWAYTEPLFWTTFTLFVSDLVRQVAAFRFFAIRSVVVLIVVTGGWINRTSTFLPDYEAGIITTGCFVALLQGLYADFRSVIRLSNGAPSETLHSQGASLPSLFFGLGVVVLVAAHAILFLHYIPESRILTRAGMDVFFTHELRPIPMEERDRAIDHIYAGYTALGRAAIMHAALVLIAVFGFWVALVTEKRRPNQLIQPNAGSRPSSTDSPASETPSASAQRG